MSSARCPRDKMFSVQYAKMSGNLALAFAKANAKVK
jgi:hypothetical protein